MFNNSKRRAIAAFFDVIIGLKLAERITVLVAYCKFYERPDDYYVKVSDKRT